jgi:nitrite reductase/ring-hydroxylating ferredoxin subunit
MARHVVARVQDIPERGRVIVTLQGHSVGVFRVRGRFFAVHNRCPHRGAELCRGSILGYLSADAPGELRYDAERVMLQCPWHGWEYDLQTGESYVKNSRIRSYEIEVEGGSELAGELRAGDAHRPLPDDDRPAEVATGLCGPKLRKGPFTAQTFPVAIEDDYVVVTLPGRFRDATVEPESASAGVDG